MKTLILYKSREGSTRKYAEWLHQEFPDSDLASIDEQDPAKLPKYDIVVVGSSTYGGQIIGRDFLANNWDKTKGKKVFLMVVGAVPQEARASKTAFQSIPEEIRNSLAGYVKLPGVSKEMGKFESLMMRIFLGADPQKVVQQNEVKKKDLQPVIEFLREAGD